MAVKKVKLPNNTTVDINDARIVGIDTTPTSASENIVTSGGVYTALSGKQDSLVSGTNIKTINNQSLLGSGNISISGGIQEVELDTSNLKSNTYISKSNGEEVTYSGWSSTYFIDISGGTQIKADRQLDYSAFYDSTEAFISSAFIRTSYLAIPSNAKYVRISGGNSDMAAATVTMITGESFVAENVANKVTSISASSTDTQYPSAKCVYDIVGNIETLLAAL